MHARRRAFTLIEILVVVAILAILLGLLLPAVQQARESARRTECLNNQKQLSLALRNFEQSQSKLPGYNSLQAVDAATVRRPASWVFALLPYLENQSVYDFHGPHGPDDSRGVPSNFRLAGITCPSDAWAASKGDGLNQTATSYVANCGQVDVVLGQQLPPDWRANGVFMHLFPYDGKGRPIRTEACTLKYISVNDGASRTLLFSENSDAGFWTGVAEAEVGFVWEATLVDGRPAPAAIARINQSTGERWEQVVAARNRELQLALASSGIACVTCYPGGPPLDPPSPPLPPWDPPPNEDPDAPPADPQPYIDQAHRALRFARPSSFHPGGVVVTFADGHGEFLDENIDYVAYCQMMAPNDSEATLAGSIDPVPVEYVQSRAQ